MLELRDAIISDDVFDKHFCCDLEKCKGACCIIGDSGAPLDEAELPFFSEIYPHVKPYLSQEHIDEIEKQGFYIVDFEGDYVTPTLGKEECVYIYKENGITKCAIEKAYFDGKISFRKPLSCHLYPIRTKQYTNYEAVNYDQQTYCKDARVNGDKLKLKVYKYLKEPLIRKYGEDWYEELLEAAEAYEEYRKSCK